MWCDPAEITSLSMWMPNLFQDPNARELTKVGPSPRRSILACYRKGAQMEGRARHLQCSVDLSANRFQYDTVDAPFVAKFGPIDALWRDAVSHPLFCRTLQDRSTPTTHDEMP